MRRSEVRVRTRGPVIILRGRRQTPRVLTAVGCDPVQSDIFTNL
jgi:hypothetical protein